MRLHATVRLRLTLVYTGFFLVAATVLVGLHYALLTQTAYQPLGSEQVNGVVITAFSDTPAARDALRAIEGDPTRAKEFLQAQRRVEAGLRAQLRADALSTMLVQSAIALAVMVLVSIGLGWLAAGRVLHPVQVITRIAKHASERNLHERVNLRGPQDELKKLADTIDGMLTRLETAFHSQRRFVASASHELRTPLSIMRTSVDVALSNRPASPVALTDMAVEVRGAVDRAEALIDSLLTLARSDQRVRETDYVDLRDVALDALDVVEAGRAERGLSVATELGDAPVRGDRALLATMVGNLVENGVRHNVEGGTLGVRTAAAGGEVVLVVTNTGPRIADELVPELFEPFRRGDAPRTGSDRSTGLGLSIVRSVVENHGGTVRARALEPGGLEVTIRLPGA